MRLFVPEGRLAIAQQFTAGKMGSLEEPSPVGTAESLAPDTFPTVPTGRADSVPSFRPSDKQDYASASNDSRKTLATTELVMPVQQFS